MKRSLSLAALSLLAGAAFAGASPQDAHHTHPQQSKESVAPAADAFARLDSNKDGVLSKAELARHPMAAHISMVDSDRNGVLSREEFARLQNM